MEKSFKKGIEFIINNYDKFKDLLFNSYLLWKSNDFSNIDSNIMYCVFNENNKKKEIISIVTNYDYISFGTQILKNINSTGWNFEVVYTDLKESILYCNLCNQNIDYSKKKIYSDKSLETDSYNLCINCFEKNKTNNLKEIITENLEYFGVNTYDSINFKYYMSLFNLKDKIIKINSTPNINNRDWDNYQKYIKYEFGEKNEEDINKNIIRPEFNYVLN